MIFRPVFKDYSPLFDSTGDKIKTANSVMAGNQEKDNIMAEIQAFDKLMQAYMEGS